MIGLGFGLGLGFGGDGGSFSPSQIPGLEMYLDAADTSTITDGTNLVLADKTGNGHDATGSGANKPTTGTHTINGKNALRYQSDVSLIPNSADLYGADGEFTDLFICNPLSLPASPYQAFFGHYGASGSRRYLVGHNVSPSYAQLSASLNGTSSVTGITSRQQFTAGDAIVIMVRKKPGSGLLEFLYNGSVNQAAAALSLWAGTASLSIGGDGAAGNKAPDLLFGKWLRWSRDVSDAEVDKIGAWAAKEAGTIWAKKAETLIVPRLNQSNQTNGWSTTTPFNNEGITAFNTEAANYYKRVEVLQTATSGYPFAVAASTPPGSYGYYDTAGDAAGPAYTNYYVANLTGTVKGRSAWGDRSKIRYIDCYGAEGDIGQATAQTVEAIEGTFNLELANSNPDIRFAITMPGSFNLSTDAGVQAMRDAWLQVLERDDCFFVGEAIHLERVDSQHINPAGQTIKNTNSARGIAADDGKCSPVIWPRVTSGTFSGDTVVLTVGELADGATLSGDELSHLRVEDDGSPVTINSLSISGNEITLTLASSIAGGSVVKFWTNYGMCNAITIADLIYDSNGYPLRTVSELVLSEA